MDAVLFLKEKDRMCKSMAGCSFCPAERYCRAYDVEDAEDLVAVVIEWSGRNRPGEEQR